MSTGCTVPGELDVIVGVRTRIDEEVEHVECNKSNLEQGEVRSTRAVRKKSCVKRQLLAAEKKKLLERTK